MREAIGDGRFGAPVELIVVCGQHFPTYRPAYREIYYRDRATGGGGIQDGITHMLNAGEWLVGPVERLVCDAAHQVLDGVEVEDTVHILTRQGRVLGSYQFNQYQAPNEATVAVVCECGTARLEAHNARWGWMTKPETPWEYEPCGPQSRDSTYSTQAGVLLDSLEGKATPLCSLDEGIQTLRVNLAALASLERREWQTIGQ
jgi:predicted dehydrogenase